MEIALYKCEEKGPHGLKFYKRLGVSSIEKLDEIIRLSNNGAIQTYVHDTKFSKEAGHEAYVLQKEDSVFLPVGNNDNSAAGHKDDSDIQSPGGIAA
jgi:hypothetical protein